MKVLVIGDTQFPFEHRDYLKFLLACADKIQPDRIVHIGDEIDFYAISRFPKLAEAAAVTQELAKAKKTLRQYGEAFPNVDVLWSNHAARINARFNEAGIPRAWSKPYEEIIEAPPGWKWHETLKIDGVLYEHGHEHKGFGHKQQERIPWTNQCSTVFGHYHTSAGVAWQKNRQGDLFGFNVGCGMDRYSYAAKYSRGPRWFFLSAGAVIDGQPILLRMPTGKTGKRWNGKLPPLLSML